MPANANPLITPEEYLRRERLAEVKSEYIDGQMIAMPRVSAAHVRINTNLAGCLGRAFAGGPWYCLSSSMRLKVNATGFFTYPDTIVLRDEPELEDDDVLLNPKIIFEVYSQASEVHDRGGKFEHYRSIPSLMEYVLISQNKPHIEQFVRQPDGRWLVTEYKGLEAVLTLSTVSGSVKLADLYQGVRFQQLTIYCEPA